jgi:hypothetical protein
MRRATAAIATATAAAAGATTRQVKVVRVPAEALQYFAEPISATGIDLGVGADNRMGIQSRTNEDQARERLTKVPKGGNWQQHKQDTTGNEVM